MINSHANLAKNAKRTFTQQCEKISFISLNARASLVLAYWIGAASLLRCSQFREICEIRVKQKKSA